MDDEKKYIFLAAYPLTLTLLILQKLNTPFIYSPSVPKRFKV